MVTHAKSSQFLTLQIINTFIIQSAIYKNSGVNLLQKPNIYIQNL